MLPKDLAKSGTEHAHQRAFFQWLNFAARWGFEVGKLVAEGQVSGKLADCVGGIEPLPELNLMHAIPNGGYRNSSDGAKLKAEGVKAGVLDTFLPVSKPPPCLTHTNRRYNGLYVEFKEPNRKNHKDGGLSEHQIVFGDGVQAQGYCVRVAYTWVEAANLVMLYYGVDTRLDTT